MIAFLKRNDEFVRFCIVGIICTGIDAGIFYTIRTIASYQIALISGWPIFQTLAISVVSYFIIIRTIVHGKK